MKFYSDTHNHTVSSGHAYSTIQEIAKEASKKGIKAIGLTDHGPEMPGGPHIFHIANLGVIPEYIEGVRILRGAEANIMDFDGNLDIQEKFLSNLEIVIASMHDVCTIPGTKEENTRAYEKAMENKYVDIIGHPVNPSFPVDFERLARKAKETNTLIEINNSWTRGNRPGGLENTFELVTICRDLEIPVTIGSDSHISFEVGEFESVEKILKEFEMPEELILNTKSDGILNYLKSKGKIK